MLVLVFFLGLDNGGIPIDEKFIRFEPLKNKIEE